MTATWLKTATCRKQAPERPCTCTLTAIPCRSRTHRLPAPALVPPSLRQPPLSPPVCRVKSCRQGGDADHKRRKLVTCSERITPHDIRDYAVLRRNGNAESNVPLIHSWRVHRASEPAPPCPRSGRLTTAGAADRKTPSNRSRGAAARPPNIGRTHSEHTNQYWPIWPILANTLFPRRGGVKHITKGPNLCAQVPCIPPMDALAGQVLCIQ